MGPHESESVSCLSTYLRMNNNAYQSIAEKATKKISKDDNGVFSSSFVALRSLSLSLLIWKKKILPREEDKGCAITYVNVCNTESCDSSFIFGSF